MIERSLLFFRIWHRRTIKQNTWDFVSSPTEVKQDQFTLLKVYAAKRRKGWDVGDILSRLGAEILFPAQVLVRHAAEQATAFDQTTTNCYTVTRWTAGIEGRGVGHIPAVTSTTDVTSAKISKRLQFMWSAKLATR